MYIHILIYLVHLPAATFSILIKRLGIYIRVSSAFQIHINYIWFDLHHCKQAYLHKYAYVNSSTPFWNKRTYDHLNGIINTEVFYFYIKPAHLAADALFCIDGLYWVTAFGLTLSHFLYSVVTWHNCRPLIWRTVSLKSN